MAHRSAHHVRRRSPHSPLRGIILLGILLVAGLTVWVSSRTTGGIAAAACGGDHPEAATGKFDTADTVAWFNNEAVSPLAEPLALAKEEGAVLGEASGEKWIDVDLSTQTIRAMEGDREVFRMLGSTGKWFPTPTGEFRIWYKVRYTKMSGGSKALNTYYYLPNVPYVMYFYQGFGLHGTYWHNNFGHPMSHGCVNLSIPDSERIFDWADPVLPDDKSSVRSSPDNPGTRVVVHGVAPKT